MKDHERLFENDYKKIGNRIKGKSKEELIKAKQHAIYQMQVSKPIHDNVYSAVAIAISSFSLFISIIVNIDISNKIPTVITILLSLIAILIAFSVIVIIRYKINKNYQQRCAEYELEIAIIDELLMNLNEKQE